jgi:dTDP-4-amino-4,6-dideoxygalactose transaminase
MGHLAVTGAAPVRTEPYPGWPVWDATEQSALKGVVESGQWWATEGSCVPEFERAFGQFQGAEQCLGVTNGTHALEVALLAADIGAGDEVIVTDYTFLASASAIATVNAIPVLVDIEPGSWCIDPDAVEAAITPRTRAVVAVHLAGHPADLDRLTEICGRHDLALIEDCAHAHGSSWRGVPVGSWGAAGTFSFQQSKLMTAGEGGAITTRDADLAAAARSFADCGRRPGEWFYRHFVLGGNFRMTEWQAAVLLAQLARYPAQLRERNENAVWLNGELSRIPGVQPQVRDDRCTAQGYYCYVVGIDEAEFGAPRDAVRRALIAEGMPLTMSYPPVHQLDAFAAPDGFAPRHRTRAGWPDYARLQRPIAERAATTTLWFRHQLLMGSRKGSDDLVEAMTRVQRYAHELGDEP